MRNLGRDIANLLLQIMDALLDSRTRCGCWIMLSSGKLALKLRLVKTHLKFNALMERAYGPPVKDKTELDAMSKGGAQVQILVLPAAQPVHGPRELPTPKFDDDKVS